MREDILNFNNQFKKGIEFAKNIKKEGDFNNLVICGMGGSGIPGTLLLTCLPYIKIPVYLHKGYDLPPQADENSLVITISFSGNTEETVSSFEKALDKKIPLMAITSNGKLKKLAEENEVPVTIINDKDIQPRVAIGYLFSSLLKMLYNSGIIGDEYEELKKLELDPRKYEEKGKELSRKLKGKVPVVYTTRNLKYLARIWKINFNENSKNASFWNYFPELNHNEMVGYTNKDVSKNFHLIILKDKKISEKNLKRINLTCNMLEKKGVSSDIIELEGKNILEKIFNSIILSYWTSFYLAKELGVDPEPVDMVEDFKKEL